MNNYNLFILNNEIFSYCCKFLRCFKKKIEWMIIYFDKSIIYLMYL